MYIREPIRAAFAEFFSFSFFLLIGRMLGLCCFHNSDWNLSKRKVYRTEFFRTSGEPRRRERVDDYDGLK